MGKAKSGHDMSTAGVRTEIISLCSSTDIFFKAFQLHAKCHCSHPTFQFQPPKEAPSQESFLFL